jgi:Spy/CpxP family protein refolding chaperone
VPADRDGLLQGEGMGQGVLAEELGFPGPNQVLELAKELELTADQVKAIKAIHAEMTTRAKELGARIIRIEGELHDAFQQNMLSERSVRDDAEQIGRLRGRLRATHLVAHLKTKAILTQKQLDRYAKLRAAPDMKKK